MRKGFGLAAVKQGQFQCWAIASYELFEPVAFWNPLRGDPRFEQIVASLAPKQ